MLALELPQEVDEFQAVTAPAPGKVRNAQYADFGFIVLYGLFFASFAFAVEDERTSSTILIFTLATMLMDVGENAFILKAVEATTSGNLRTVLIFGCLKWMSFFAIVLAMAQALFDSGGFWRIAGYLLRVAALVGMFGAAASFLSVSARPLVTVASREAALTIVAIFAATAWRAARKYFPRAAPATA